MDNFFITEYFDWKIRRFSLLDRLISRLLSKMLGKTEFRSAVFFDNIYAELTGNAIIPSTSGVMTNVEQRINMYHLVNQVLAYGVEGDFVELGCNSGESSVLITKLLQAHNSDKKFSVYDSFDGLPEAKPVDGTIYKKGFCQTSEDVLRDNFERYNVPLPDIYKGWFQDTLPSGLPERISFAYLDGDFYDFNSD